VGEAGGNWRWARSRVSGGRVGREGELVGGEDVEILWIGG